MSRARRSSGDQLVLQRYRRHWLWNLIRYLFSKTSGVQTATQ
jgi:hypothetical protein